MGAVTDYKVIESESLDAMNAKILLMLADGWLPIHQMIVMYEPPYNRCKFYKEFFKKG